MRPARFDIVAIGNALVDVLCHQQDDFLDRFALAKGLMSPIAPDRAVLLHRAMGDCEEISGGSAANTLAALATVNLGTGAPRCAFIGQVGKDRLGQLFADDMTASRIHFPLPAIDVPTGRCLIIVSPDGHRTMNTAIGASEYLPGAALDRDLIADAAILYVEGYMWRTPEPRAAVYEAIEIAPAHGRKVALTLASEFVISEHRVELLDMIEARKIDILFANEGEIAALSQSGDFDAGVAWLAERVPLLIATRGPDGAIAIEQGRRYEAPAEALGPLLDTTGAGDLFAAGVFAGLIAGRDLQTTLRMGSIAAGRVITLMGPRLPAGDDLGALIAERLR